MASGTVRVRARSRPGFGLQAGGTSTKTCSAICSEPRSGNLFMINPLTPGSRVHLSAILGLALVAAPGVVAAQNTQLAPLYGSGTMSHGFRPDPHEVTVRAGGPVNLEGRSMPEACRGYITEAATYEVRWTAGGVSPLVFRTASDDDTVLLVKGPDGKVFCDDDSGPGLDAKVVFETPTSGFYDVWVGLLGAGTSEATLSVSGLRSSAEEDEEGELEAAFWDEFEPETQPTNISIRACNAGGLPALVAVSYIPEGDSRFVTRGWTAIASGTCSTLATTINSRFYLYGVTTDGTNREWAGDVGTCVRLEHFFEYVPTGQTCLPGQVIRMFHRHIREESGEAVWTMY